MLPGRGYPRQWRQWQLLAAVVVGFAAGAADWVIEAYVRFGGPLNRLHEAGAEQGGFGLHFALWDEFRSVNGPTLCRPCTVGLRYPELSLWWLALPVLVVLGGYAAYRAGRLASGDLAAASGSVARCRTLIDPAEPWCAHPAGRDHGETCSTRNSHGKDW